MSEFPWYLRAGTWILVLTAIFLGGIVWALIKAFLTKPSPPSKPLLCPACGGEVETLSSGFWTGYDKKGDPFNGTFDYGTCRKCAGRVACHTAYGTAQEPYAPSDEEWREHFKPLEQSKRERESWPFPVKEEKLPE